MLISLAWHIEAFQRTKRLPPLKRLLSQARGKERQYQKPEELEQTLLSFFTNLSNDSEVEH